MAIIRLDCNLNGGDSVTPNNELFYRIYGDVDNYAAPIWTTGTALSDANVTVDNDRVIITGVDGTTNTLFKIASVDLDGNEAVLSPASSPAYDYELNIDRTLEQCITVPKAIQAGDTLVLRVAEWLETSTSKYLVSNGIGTTTNGYFSLRNVDGADRVKLYVCDSVGAKAGANNHIFAGDDVIEIRFVSASRIEYWANGVEKTPIITDGFAFVGTDVNIGAYTNVGALGPNVVIDSFDIGNESFPLNEGSGTTTTGSEGTIGTLVNDPTWILK